MHGEFKEFCKKKLEEFCEKFKVSPIPSWRLLWKNVLKSLIVIEIKICESCAKEAECPPKGSVMCAIQANRLKFYREKQCALVSKPDVGFQFSQELLVHLFD